MTINKERSFETNKCLELLQVLKPGETLSYQSIAAEVGRPVNGAAPFLTSARRILQREERMTFDIVIGFGVKRLSDSGTVGCSDKRIQKLRRHSTRSLRFLSCANYENLSMQDRLKHATNATIFAMSRKATSKKAVALIEERAAGVPLKLSLNRTLEFFLKPKKQEPPSNELSAND